jgi:flagellar biosynthesis/type III secretory pathway protein FliH
MGAVIKASRVESSGTLFQFDDMSQAYLGKVRQQADQLLAQARQEAEKLKAAATQEGRQQGLASVDKQVRAQVDEQLKTILPALTQAVQAIQTARHEWRARWEQSVVELACGIAKQIIRREFSRQPEITLDLVREALELASGNDRIALRLNPQDHAHLGDRAAALASELAGLGPVEILADPAVTSGGCKVCTEFGVIDQQIESQLSRIAEELLAND